MSKKLSQSQERLALLIGSGTLLGLGLSRKRPAWSGVVLAGIGALLVQGGVSWLRSGVRKAAPISDIVDEASEESFPTSDPPAWALGKR